jgi:hypothetical protein
MDNKNIQFEDAADAFNEYFLNIANSLQTQIKGIHPLNY